MTNQQLFDQLTSLIPPAMQHLHVPGVAIGIMDGDQQFSAGFGITNLENPLPVSAETLFQIGSITKTVTATAMMRLVERGLVDLDVPVRSLPPQFASGGQLRCRAGNAAPYLHPYRRLDG